MYKIGLAMGKTRQYMSSVTARGSCPRADTLARMLGVCDYKLCALPVELVPPDALVIDSGEASSDMSAQVRELREKRDQLLAEQEALARKIDGIEEQLRVFG